jgi:hypothetical protein
MDMRGQIFALAPREIKVIQREGLGGHARRVQILAQSLAKCGFPDPLPARHAQHKRALGRQRHQMFGDLLNQSFQLHIGIFRSPNLISNLYCHRPKHQLKVFEHNNFFPFKTHNP